MRRALIGISILFNLVVALTLLWLANGGGFKLIRTYLLDPSHARAVSQFEAVPVSAGDNVFLGDSITEGGHWSELFPELPVRNRGIGGDTTAGVLERLSQVTGGKPARVFLMIGTNDLGTSVPEDDIVSNVSAILTRIQAESPQTLIYLQSVLPRSADFRDRVESLNLRLEGLAGDTGASFVDLFPLFLDEADGSIRDDLANDELHLLGGGYLLWRDTLEPLIRP